MIRLCLFVYAFTAGVVAFHSHFFWRALEDRNYFCVYAKQIKPTKRSSANVDKYLQLRELVRAQKQGASYEELKELSINGSINSQAGAKSKPSYNRLLGKGNLDQRLRAIIAYKRSSNPIDGSTKYMESGMTREEETDLDAVMDEDDQTPTAEDDEEAIYESLVLQAMENKKLSQIRQNMLGEEMVAGSGYVSVRAEVVDEHDTNQTTSSVEASSNPSNMQGKDVSEEDLYTPAVSTWGVYKRPRDISKTFGGGRSISKEEMDRLDEEMEQQEQQKELNRKKFVTASMQKEQENEKSIDKALKQSRAYMRAGSRKEAVAVLESVREFVSFQTDIGGQVLLELGMAFETVDRVDEARQIYGQLAASSWSQTIRRQALQLISGLDIIKQIRKDGNFSRTGQHGMDKVQLVRISQALEKGLTNEWNDFKKDKKKDRFSPWFDDGSVQYAEGDVKVNTLNEAYGLLLSEIHPLRSIPSSSLIKAMKKFYLSSTTDKISFVSQKRPLSMLKSLPYTPKNISDIWVAVNGSWDLVSSIIDSSPYTAQRYETGSIRRVLDIYNKQYTETNAVLWGLSTVKHNADIIFSPQRLDIELAGDQLRKSSSPWQRRAQAQTFQVTYCDDLLMITRQLGESIQDSDLYTLWKRAKDVVWNKY